MHDSLVRLLFALRLYGPLRSTAERIAALSPAHARRERAMGAFYGRFVRPGDLCFDVGANVGNRTEVFLALGAKVVAVDPQPSCVRALRKRYDGDSRVIVVPRALGEREGKAEFLLSDASTISSLSRDWIEAVRRSGRFRAYRWNRTVNVTVTTLDCLIEEHGVPAFVKIDVEGYELPVLRGLSRPVGALSFEFVPEFIDAAVAAARHLDRIGMTRFNYSSGESMSLALSEWVGAEEIAGLLESFADPGVWGDVYARGDR